MHSTRRSIYSVVYEGYLKRIHIYTQLLWIFGIFIIHSFISDAYPNLLQFCFSPHFRFSLVERKLTNNRQPLDARECGKEKERKREMSFTRKIGVKVRLDFLPSVFFVSLFRSLFRMANKIIYGYCDVLLSVPFLFFVSWSGTSPFQSEAIRYFYPWPPPRPSVFSLFFSFFTTFFELRGR